jgi:hypothetical protein
MILFRVEHVLGLVGEATVLSQEARSDSRGLRTRRARAEVATALDVLDGALTGAEESMKATRDAIIEAKNWTT